MFFCKLISTKEKKSTRLQLIIVRFLALVTTMVTNVDYGNHRSNDRGNHHSNHRSYYEWF